MSTRSENHATENILDFWQVKAKSYGFPRNLNIPTELLSFPKFETYSVKLVQQTTADSKSNFFPYPLQSPYRARRSFQRVQARKELTLTVLEDVS